MFQHSPWWSAPPWTAAPHQQRPGWVTWTWGRSQTEPRTHASAPQALTPRSNPGSAALARAAARRSRLKDRGGLCCYYQPYTATLAAGGNESRRCLSVRADRGEGDETHVWKKSRRSNAIVWLLIPFRLIKRVLRSHISACWRDSHQNTAQHNTAQTANTHQAVFGEGANGKLCTPGWVVVVGGVTRVQLHYCSLLFHCLISQRLIDMHASCDWTRWLQHRMQGLLSCFQAKKRLKEGHSRGAGLTRQMPPAVPGSTDIRDSEEGRDEPDISSPCFS